MADVLHNGGTTYRIMVEDIYDQGYYLLTSKYRYLRFSYACFLVGFVAAAVQFLVIPVFGILSDRIGRRPVYMGGAAAVAAFGMLLRDSPHKGQATFDQVLQLSSAVADTPRRREFIELVRLAQKLSSPDSEPRAGTPPTR